MNQIKIISNTNYALVERLCNDWLDENNSKIKVTDIKFNSIIQTEYVEGELTIMIHYTTLNP